MGQRHQIFIRTINPYHHTYGEDKAKARRLFGTHKTTVLAYHNQWLYGRSALLSALNILEFNEGFTKDERFGKKPSMGYNNPFHNDFIRSNEVDSFLRVVESTLNLCREENEFRGKGWLGSWLLNHDEPQMREFFTYGDNNDGITIIDTLENKYCFMNVHGYGNEEDSFNVGFLPYLKPCSGKKYVEAYCPSSASRARNSYYGQQALEKGELEFRKYVSKAKRINNKLVKRLDKFGLLTENELRKIFGKQYAELDKKS